MSDKPRDRGKPEDFKTRATDFVDSVLDALRNPDPEYLARRAKFVEQKKREDAESLARFHRERAAKRAAKEAAASVGTSSTASEERPIRLAGTPRSLPELEFVATMQPCARCRAYSEPAWKTVDSDREWFISAPCDTCKRTRSYVATADQDLIEVESPPLQLGGILPSTTFDARHS